MPNNNNNNNITENTEISLDTFAEGLTTALNTYILREAEKGFQAHMLMNVAETLKEQINATDVDWKDIQDATEFLRQVAPDLLDPADDYINFTNVRLTDYTPEEQAIAIEETESLTKGEQAFLNYVTKLLRFWESNVEKARLGDVEALQDLQTEFGFRTATIDWTQPSGRIELDILIAHAYCANKEPHFILKSLQDLFTKHAHDSYCMYSFRELKELTEDDIKKKSLNVMQDIGLFLYWIIEPLEIQELLWNYYKGQIVQIIKEESARKELPAVCLTTIERRIKACKLFDVKELVSILDLLYTLILESASDSTNKDLLEALDCYNFWKAYQECIK